MIPEIENDLETDIVATIPTSYTYGLNTNQTRFYKHIDGAEAMKQAIWLILHTERYAYFIYSWNYGVELCDKIGSNMALGCLHVQNAVCEALKQDDRISMVDHFSFTKDENKLCVSFTVHTIFGELESGVELNV